MLLSTVATMFGMIMISSVTYIVTFIPDHLIDLNSNTSISEIIQNVTDGIKDGVNTTLNTAKNTAEFISVLYVRNMHPNTTLEEINKTQNHIIKAGERMRGYDEDIIEIWKEYKIKYNEYYAAYNQQIFYSKEINDESIHQLVLIGVTGTGKSLFGNRLSGYQGDDDQNGYFTVSGDVQSCTKNISKLIVYNLYPINISILDTPGIFDSNNEDIIHQNNLIKYLQGSDGINAFIMVLKKDRLSQFIQEMLKQFADNFGDAFWAHLIFVINFWDEHDETGFDQWKVQFVDKIRDIFNLKDKETYPLNIVGLNAFDSYRSQITHDLVPNIPSNRLNSEQFRSPLQSLTDQLFKLNETINRWLNDRYSAEMQVNAKCEQLSELYSLVVWIWNKPKDSLDDIKEIYEVNCFVDNAEIVYIQRQLKKFKVFGTENNEIASATLKSNIIDFNENDNNILSKFYYFSEHTGQNVIKCMQQNGLFLNNVELKDCIQSILSYGYSTLMNAAIICSQCVKNDVALCCEGSTMKQNDDSTIITTPDLKSSMEIDVKNKSKTQIRNNYHLFIKKQILRNEMNCGYWILFLILCSLGATLAIMKNYCYMKWGHLHIFYF